VISLSFARQHHTNWGKTETISSKARKKTKVSAPLLLNLVLYFFTRGIRQEEEIKGTQTRKK
jgi:hypothetical protein